MTKNLYKQKREEGFTIIEVLIVLAIAGLIILIVFLAVPALQRNSRNTAYRNEAANLLAATNEFITNKSGTMPAASGSGTAGSDAAEVFANAKTKNVTTLNVVVPSGAPAAVSPAFDTATIVTRAKCPAPVTGTSITPTSGSGRAFVIVYAVEKNDGTVIASCTEG